MTATTPAILLPTTETSSPTGLAVVEGGGLINCVIVHPVVLLSILDHHTRRPDAAGRVIGTLLGRRDGDKIEVTNCFAVPHAERGDEVAIGKDFNRQMLALHLRANRNEILVGWYATALPPNVESDSSSAGYRCIADTSSLIHEFYADECEEDPIHLVVDTSLQTDSLALRAYKSEAISILQEPVANIFHELRLIIRSSESEKTALDKMIQAQQQQQLTDALTTTPALLEADTHSLQISLERLYDMLVTSSSYVDQVVAGKIPADDAMGRLMADTLASIPRIRPELFDKVFSDTLQDLLMVTYLSNMTRTQLTIAEKINAVLDQPVK